jgi:hypothetical protein
MIFNYGGKPPSPDQMADTPPAGPLGPAAQVRESIAADPSSEGWEGFQAFRDKVIGSPDAKKPKGKGERKEA